MPSSAARSVKVVQYAFDLSVTPTRTVTGLSGSAVVGAAAGSPPEQAASAPTARAARTAVSLRFMVVLPSGGSERGARLGAGPRAGRWPGPRGGGVRPG